MSATRQRGYRRLTSTAVALIGAGALVAGCTGNEPESSGGGGGGNNAASDNDEAGDTVTIGFSAPGGRPRLDRRHHRGRPQPRPSSTTTSTSQVAEGTNDVSTQISQVETFINDGVDAIVLLPFDGAALTPVALKAMEAGIPVINVDREFDEPVRRPRHDPRRQLRHGRLGRHLHLLAAGGQAERRRRRDRRHRLAAADPGPQPGLRRRARRAAASRSATGSPPTSPSRAARRRRPTCSRPRRRSTPSGTTTTTRASASWPRSRTPAATSSSWSAAPARPTRCAPSRPTTRCSRRRSSTRHTQAADGIKLARLIVQDKNHVRPESQGESRGGSCSTPRS